MSAKKNMTIEEITKIVSLDQELVKSYDEAQNAVAKLNEAYAMDSHAGINGMKEAASAAVNEYNTAKKAAMYKLIMNTENPMLTALTIGFVDVVKLSTAKEKGSDVESAELKDASEVIDLIDIENRHGKFSANGQWRFWVQKLSYNLAARASLNLGMTPDKFAQAYKLGSTARACDLGADPTSITQLTAQFQMIADAILYEDKNGKNAYRVYDKDTYFVLYVMCKEGKANLGVTMPTDKSMIRLITKVMHRIVTKGHYEPEFENSKRK